MASFKAFQVVHLPLKCLKVSPKSFKAAMCHCSHFPLALFSLWFMLSGGNFEYKCIQFKELLTTLLATIGADIMRPMSLQG